MQNAPVPEIDLKLCDRCGHCVAVCPTGALRMTDRGPEISQPALCTYCAICEDICPLGAIRAAYEIGWAASDAGPASSNTSL